MTTSLAIGNTMARLGGYRFSPASLFAAGEQGAWYDPSDVSINWRRNLLTYTEEFDNGAWVKNDATITSNAVIAPNGTLTADAIIPTVGFSQHYISQTIAVGTYTYTLYAKAFGYTLLTLAAFDGVTSPAGWPFRAIFDLANGVVALNNGGGPASIQAVGNGWYRCSVTGASAASAGFRIQVTNTTADANASFSGDGTSGIYIWGAQLELGSTATAYQQIITPEITYLQTIQPQPVLFTDAAGTTPVTGVGQFVGLMLDKSKGLVLGPELVTNGDFSSGTTGWTLYQSTLSAVGGKLRVTSTGSSPGAYCTISVVSGKTYEVTFDVDVGTVPTGAYYIGNSLLGGGSYTISASGRYTFRFLSGTTNAAYIFYIHKNTGASAGQYFDLDNVSVKELAGNHAFQTSSAKRPKLAARYNLLTYSEQFDVTTGGWTKLGNAVVSANQTAAPNGTNTADLLYATANSSGSYIVQQVATGGAAVVFTVFAKAQNKSVVWLYHNSSATYGNYWVDLTDGSTQISNGSTTTGTLTVGPDVNGWRKISVAWTQSNSGGAFGIGVSDSKGSYTFTANGTDGIYIWGADLRPASQATGAIGPTYQRVAAATVYDTAGFLPYLAFDGLDDSMSTGSIDFSAGDKMTVWAGVRKLNDSTAGAFLELSASSGSNNGTFGIFAPQIANDYFFRSRGTANSDNNITTYTPPITSVFTAIGDISLDVNIIRINAVQIASVTTDQGSGNYGNYPLYIGMRAGSTLPFNGWLTSLIVRGAPPVSLSQESLDLDFINQAYEIFDNSISISEIEATETWVNSKTGAY